jgi:hypothetical protein
VLSGRGAPRGKWRRRHDWPGCGGYRYAWVLTDVLRRELADHQRRGNARLLALATPAWSPALSLQRSPLSLRRRPRRGARRPRLEPGASTAPRPGTRHAPPTTSSEPRHDQARARRGHDQQWGPDTTGSLVWFSEPPRSVATS